QPWKLHAQCPGKLRACPREIRGNCRSKQSGCSRDRRFTPDHQSRKFARCRKGCEIPRREEALEAGVNCIGVWFLAKTCREQEFDIVDVTTHASIQVGR